MSWRGRDERSSRWEQDSRRENRARSPVWELRRSTSPFRRSPQRDRRHRDEKYSVQRDRYDHDRRDGRDRHERDSGRHERDSDRYRRDRYDRSRDHDRERRRSPKRYDEEIPAAPSPPTISADMDLVDSKSSKSRSRSGSGERNESEEKEKEKIDRENHDINLKHDDVQARHDEYMQSVNASPGDWFCSCGLYNFKRRQVCYRRNCNGKRSDGIVYSDRNVISETPGITKCILVRRLDALTTEEKILEVLKERCSKDVLDSIAGITIGRETLTGASKCLAHINFNSIADSAAAHTQMINLQPPLVIDGREVLIRFYNEQKKVQKSANSDYSSYYAQMANYGTPSQALSEADRVNAAAAVAQSAITAAQARQLSTGQMSWTPVAAPTFVTSNVQVTPVANVPTGDSKTVYNHPDVRTFMYDETSGYYYDPATGLYYDGTTQYFYNSQTNQYMYWDASSCTYIAASQAQQNTEQPKLPNPSQPTEENTISKEPEEKKKITKEDKVKVAKKIAKDMERWARTLNQKKENARSNVVMEQVLDTSASKGSADIGFSVLGAGPSIMHVRELSPPPPDDFLMKKVAVEPVVESETDEGIIDWAKLTCLLCKRKFPSPDVLNKHKSLSDLHKQNLAEFRAKNDLLPQINGYRDRAAERRMKFGEDETPIVRKRYEPPAVMSTPVAPHPPPSVVDTIGGKMLQKMGWSEGRGLGKTEQGRIAPIEAEQRPSLAGLGQKRGIYTPTPGETYRDTVKKLMIARYKEVVGQEEGK